MRDSQFEYVGQQYRTDEALTIRIETHRRYGFGPSGDIFSRITRVMAERRLPLTVLDAGAGTGNWYRAIREDLNGEVMYAAADQSSGMVDVLLRATHGDHRAEVRRAAANSLPWEENVFDWVGAHFMLYHVPDISGAIQEALRVAKPGAVVAAATNAAKPYRELWDLGEWAARELHVSGRDPDDCVRFNLETGAAFFPTPPECVVWAGGFRFDAPEPALAYMASGPIRHHLGDAASDEGVVRTALRLIGERIGAIIASDGVFTVHSESGLFLVRKPW